jgi:ATP-binding cassette subfamily A (ABC1) protein 5
MVLDGSGKERHIARLVKGHVTKAERARRHGRELSFILPHDSVGCFAALFNAIEAEIKSGISGLGISSYGVSMTTLEEVIPFYTTFNYNQTYLLYILKQHV